MSDASLSSDQLTSKQLLPCPFCGAAAREFLWQQHFGCSNEQCGAHAANLTREQWNKRTAVPPTRSLGEFWASVEEDTGELKLIDNDPIIFKTSGPHKNPGVKHARVRVMQIPEPSADNFEQWRVATAAKIAYETPSDSWMIWYADCDVSPEYFSGYGAERAARSRFSQAKDHWTVRLFKSVDQSGYGPPETKAEDQP